MSPFVMGVLVLGTFLVIHLEVGSSESRDSHGQKPVSPSDKRVSPYSILAHFLYRMCGCRLFG